MKLSKYVKLVKGGGYCMVAHVEDSGIWLGTRSAIFRATELPDMVGEEQVRTVLDMPEKAWEKVHFDERWEGTVKSIFGMNLSDYADGEQDTEKLKVMAAPDGLWCDCRRSMDDGELIFYREAMLSPLAEQIKESDYIRYTVRKMEGGCGLRMKMGWFTHLRHSRPWWWSTTERKQNGMEVTTENEN